jgi:3-oxoacyl-[acyl-carrier-protein] synthase II
MEDHRRSGTGNLEAPNQVTKRIVITGIGAISALGENARASFDAVLRSQSATKPIQSFPTESLPIQIACEIGAWFDPVKRFGRRHADQMDRFAHFASASALDAWEDSRAKGHYPSERSAVVMASGLGGVLSLLQAADALREHGARRVSPFTVPKVLPSIGAGWVSILLGLRGPNLSPATACAAGAHAIIQGAQLIQNGEADVVLAGGAEAPICAVGVASFAAMRALSATSCKPFSIERDGFVLGEGAATIVLEEREAALARGATIYAELAGYGQSGDGHHLTAPIEDGEGCLRAMKQALQRAHLTPEEVGYINAHATGTKAGDLAEAKAIYSLFQEKTMVSSTKGATGHLLGAAGALEAVFTILALQRQIMPPNTVAAPLDPECKISVVPSVIPAFAGIQEDNSIAESSFAPSSSDKGEARQPGDPSRNSQTQMDPRFREGDGQGDGGKTVSLRYALSNSMGFGGTNASLLFAKADATDDSGVQNTQ